MTKEYKQFLKANDPIHYSEMMGDPVTGLNTNTGTNLSLFLAVIVLVGIGVLIGITIC